MNKYTLVTTCLNEISNISSWIEDVCAQARAPDEIVILDAGSSDGTLDKLNEWSKNDCRVKVLFERKASVARGRNLAIRSAAHDIIVSTDMGCRIDSEWFLYITTPFETTESCDVVVGNFNGIMPKSPTIWSRVAWALNNGNAAKMDEHMLPSSRSIAFRKSVWENLGFYPEDLTYAADDTVFGMQIRAGRFHVHLASGAVVHWLRPNSLGRYAKERRGYGFGEGEAAINTPKLLLLWPDASQWAIEIASFLQTLRSLPRTTCSLIKHRCIALLPMALFFQIYCTRSFLSGYRSGLANGAVKCLACRARVG